MFNMGNSGFSTFDLPQDLSSCQSFSAYNKINKQEELFIFGAEYNGNIYSMSIKNNKLIYNIYDKYYFNYSSIYSIFTFCFYFFFVKCVLKVKKKCIQMILNQMIIV